MTPIRSARVSVFITNPLTIDYFRDTHNSRFLWFSSLTSAECSNIYFGLNTRVKTYTPAHLHVWAEWAQCTARARLAGFSSTPPVNHAWALMTHTQEHLVKEAPEWCPGNNCCGGGTPQITRTWGVKCPQIETGALFCENMWRQKAKTTKLQLVHTTLNTLKRQPRREEGNYCF